MNLRWLKGKTGLRRKQTFYYIFNEYHFYQLVLGVSGHAKEGPPKESGLKRPEHKENYLEILKVWINEINLMSNLGCLRIEIIW